MDLKRRLNVHRVLSLTVAFLALVGWGAFAYSAGSSLTVERQLLEELAQAKAGQDELLAKERQRQQTLAESNQLQTRLASARQEVEALARKREETRAQVAAGQQALVALTERREERLRKGSETGTARAAKLSTKRARVAAQAKRDKAPEKSRAQAAKPTTKPTRLAAPDKTRSLRYSRRSTNPRSAVAA